MALIKIAFLDMGISILFGLGFLIGAREVRQLRVFNLFAYIMFFGVLIFGFEILDNLNSTLFTRLVLLATYSIAGFLFLYAYKVITDKRKVIFRVSILTSSLLLAGLISHFATGGLIRPFYLLNSVSLGFYTASLALCIIKSFKFFNETRSYLILYRAILLLPFLALIYTAFQININLFFSIRLLFDPIILFYAHILVIVAIGINFTLEGASSIIDQLRKDSSTDELTGIPNRRYFNQMVEHQRNSRRVDPDGQFIALLDLDYFKKINDKYGHDTGDFVLKEIAHYLSICSRGGDILARYGGEEFVVYFECGDTKEAEALVERIRNRIESLVLTMGDLDIKVTLSIGYSSVSDKYESLETILKRADEALYSAKEQGRNRCVRK